MESTMENLTEIESTMENLTEVGSERVELGADKEIESGELRQDDVKEMENENPGEEAPCPMVTSLVTPRETNDDDPPKIDDENNSQLETSPPEEGLINPTVEDTPEENIVSTEVSSDILKEDDGDAVKVDKDDAPVLEAEIPDSTLLEEDTGSLLQHDDIVMEQEKAAEEDDMIASGDHGEFAVNPDNIHSEEEGSLHHHANTVMEQDKAAEEHEIISSGDHNEFPANPDAKVVEENNESMDEGEANNVNLAGDGSGPVDHDHGTTRELDTELEVPGSETISKLEDTREFDKGLEVPGSETVSKLEDTPSEPLLEASMNVEKEPDMPATENLTDNDKNSDVLAVRVSEDSDKGLSVLPATQNPSDHDEGMTIVDAEATEDMELDLPGSKLVADATVDSANNKDVNVEANTEKPDNSRERVINDTDNVSAQVRRGPGPRVASSNIKSEARGSGDLNNGVHKIVRTTPGFDGTMRPKHSFLLDDRSDGNESGTEEDQSDFMKELDSFFKERNMDFKPPKFYGEGLNCLKLWRAVTRLGGYDKVTGSKLWRQVGESFRPPKTCTTVSWTFRGFYEKALLEYERHKVSGGELQIPLPLELEPMNIDNHASGSGRARRDSAARAMQGWHSQRLNGNGEVSDPAAIKDKNLVLHQKREKQIGTSPGLLKRKRPAEYGVKNANQVSKPMLDVTVVDVGPPADWVKINVLRTQDCFEVYALVPGLVREEVRVQSDPAGRLVISGEPENPMNPWGATPFKKVVSLPTRIDPHHTSAVVTLNGQLFVRVPLEQLG
ncbi:PREDICTED: AT-rich interactive domain-containing protein 3 [Camelina sativa]|uniref:AT-rich interactive domain-containing protein 3 n=1 Tax=Camelina sativa TaxID=90675 RepID=A0ABM0W968_CAMSA|nr:PREDICTED: AT-rich interactive domain-containing protein 3 [Camelina sativa]